MVRFNDGLSLLLNMQSVLLSETKMSKWQKLSEHLYSKRWSQIAGSFTLLARCFVNLKVPICFAALERKRFKPVYSGLLRFLKNVSAITRCLLYRGFQVISWDVNFAKFACFKQFCDVLPAKSIVKLLIQEIREILDDS